jgi:hypothetical protein
MPKIFLLTNEARSLLVPLIIRLLPENLLRRVRTMSVNLATRFCLVPRHFYGVVLKFAYKENLFF